MSVDAETFSFGAEKSKPPEHLQAAFAKTEEALKKMWEREKQEARTVYEITIPSQTLTISGKEHAEYVLRSLKGLRVSDTYRITRK